MSRPLQPLIHSDPEILANGQTKEPYEARHLSYLPARKNVPMACFDPPLEVVPTRNPITYNTKAADPVHPDFAGLLVKNKTLSSELRNLQSKLFIKETSLQGMKTELESYKENNAQQLLQIMSLRDDIKDLQELIAFLMKIKILKNTNFQNLERGNLNLTERVIELENRLRDYLMEREKAERKSGLLEKRLCCSCRFPPRMNLKGQEDSLDIVPVKDKGEDVLATNFDRDLFNSKEPNNGQKVSDKCQQDLVHKEKLTSELDRPPNSCSWEMTPEQAHHQDFLSQLATLLSDSISPIPAREEAVKERIQEMGANEQSWKSRTEALQQEVQALTKRLEQLYRLYEEATQESPQTEENDREQKQPLKHLEGNIAVRDVSPERLYLGRKRESSRAQTSQTDKLNKKFKQLEMLLNIQQNSEMATTPRMEEKIQKLQKQLSDLKLSNKNMKTQLTRINVLKDKTMERLRQSVTKVESVKEKAAPKADNLKTTLESTEQEARPGREKVPQPPAGLTQESSTTKGSLRGPAGREQELADFRETIMKMLGFNMKTADKEVINQLRLVIRVYEISSKSKIDSDCGTGLDK